MSYSEKLKALKASLQKDKPDMLLSFGSAMLVAFFAFTFLAGLVFTVIPLLRNMWMHILWHFIEPINRWVAAEPVTGGAIMFLFKAAGVVLLLWLFRKWLMFIPYWIMAQFESPKKKPTKTIKRAPLARDKLKSPE